MSIVQFFLVLVFLIIELRSTGGLARLGHPHCFLQRSAFVFDGHAPPVAFVQSMGEHVSFVERVMMVEFELNVLAMQIIELE